MVSKVLKSFKFLIISDHLIRYQSLVKSETSQQNIIDSIKARILFGRGFIKFYFFADYLIRV